MGRVKEMGDNDSAFKKLIDERPLINIEEIEWFSNCCLAPPQYELHDTGEYDKVLRNEEEFDTQPVGMCSQCKEGAIFYIVEEDSDEFLGR